MKKILNILLLVALCVSMATCSKMDATYEQFIKNGPVVYIGRVDSLSVFSGRNRVKMTWAKQGDPRAKKAVITWSNGGKSMEVALDPTKRTEFIIDNLDEASYLFSVQTFDDRGNKSLLVDISGTVYGNVYEGYLPNRTVSAFAYVAATNTATITFKASPETTLTGTKIDYTDVNGNVQTYILDKASNKAVIIGYKGASFDYSAVYMPDPLAIDSFYAAKESYSTPSAI